MGFCTFGERVGGEMVGRRRNLVEAELASPEGAFERRYASLGVCVDALKEGRVWD